MAAMELKLDRTAFLGALYKAQGVVDRKSTVNVLSHVLLETVDDGTVRLTGTDFDVVLQAEIPAEVLEAGRTCVNGKSLFDVVKNIPDGTVHLRLLSNHWVEVTAGRSAFKLAGISAADFPEITPPADIAWVGMARATLKDLIDKTIFSVSNDETRMNLNGVFFRVDPAESDLARLTMVSTDGHRLSKVEIDTELRDYKGQSFKAIVHKKGVHEVRRLLDDDSEVIEVGWAGTQILFRAGGTTFTVRQIEDTYPDYNRVIPASSPIKLTIDRQALIAAVRRIAILTSSKTYVIKTEIETGRMAITSSNPDYGEGRDELDVNYEGEGMVIGFNYQYLLDVLNVVRGETVGLELSDEFSPTVLTSPAEPGALFVVMPMRI